MEHLCWISILIQFCVYGIVVVSSHAHYGFIVVSATCLNCTATCIETLLQCLVVHVALNFKVFPTNVKCD